MLANSSPVWKQAASYWYSIFDEYLNWTYVCMCLCTLFIHKSIFKLNCLIIIIWWWWWWCYSFDCVELLMISNLSYNKNNFIPTSIKSWTLLNMNMFTYGCSSPQVIWLVNQPSLTDFEFYSEYLWMQAISGHSKLENIVIKRSKIGHVYIL